MNPNKLIGLPPRQPRGSPDNMIRALMMPHMMSGMSAEEAKAKVIEWMKEVINEATQSETERHSNSGG